MRWLGLQMNGCVKVRSIDIEGMSTGCENIWLGGAGSVCVVVIFHSAGKGDRNFLGHMQMSHSLLYSLMGISS